MVEAVQLRLLRELESISTQLADVRKLAPAGPSPRLSPPAPAIPSAVQSISEAAVKGSSSAPIVLIEYADFQCPYCGQFARQILPELEKRYVATGKMRVVFKHLPLQEIHPQAMMAAEAAECGREQGRFWQMHDALFGDQRLDETSLLDKARTTGLDIPRFAQCVRGSGGVKVRQDLAGARSLGLAVTPSFLLGRDVGTGVKVEQILTGVRSVEAFSAAIEPMLNERLPK
jgi:protein-disulfide isomerase